MVEGEKVGTLDLITVSGNSAKVETVKDGFDGPVSLVQVGDVAMCSMIRCVICLIRS